MRCQTQVFQLPVVWSARLLAIQMKVLFVSTLTTLIVRNLFFVGTVSSLVELKRRQNLNRTKDAVALLRKKKFDTAVNITGAHKRSGSMGKQMMTLALDHDEDFFGGVDDIEVTGGSTIQGINTRSHMAPLEKSYLQDTQIPESHDILCAKLRNTSYKLSVNSRVSGAFKQGLEYQTSDKFRKALKVFSTCCKREPKAPVCVYAFAVPLSLLCCGTRKQLTST